MSVESLAKARAAQAEVRARPETVYRCPKDQGCWIAMLIPVQETPWCRHGVMKRVP